MDPARRVRVPLAHGIPLAATLRGEDGREDGPERVVQVEGHASHGPPPAAGRDPTAARRGGALSAEPTLEGGGVGLRQLVKAGCELGACLSERVVPGLDDEVGASPLLGVWDLPSEDRLELCRAHPWPLQHPRPLDF